MYSPELGLHQLEGAACVTCAAHKEAAFITYTLVQIMARVSG